MLSFLICFVLPFASADLRKASQPRHDWKVQQRNQYVPFITKFALYMEPSVFGYQGLANQRDGGGYDNFLRSNIDNEQDRRNFNTEDGKDHLPFRTYETAANDVGQATIDTKMVSAAEADTGVTAAGNCIYADEGVPMVAPLRWNNPHSSELEMNIWIMNWENGPYVVPIMRPSCSGEGYQDNVYRWTVPVGFNTATGSACKKVGDCVMQRYAHSVESRMYADGVPIIVRGNDAGTFNFANAVIKEAEKDVGYDVEKLRRLCLPTSDPQKVADWKTTVIYKARLSSDVYNHAYQNSDFSPYAGQQPQYISQNLQASCLLKMTANNFGELGKQYMQKTANEARDYANKLDKKARGLVRNYETTTNSIINAIKANYQNSFAYGKAEALAANPGAAWCTMRMHGYNRWVGGREHGRDRTGGYCKAGETCMCWGDCYKEAKNAAGEEVDDAYCATLTQETDPETGLVKTKADPENPEQQIPTGLLVKVPGSETARNLIQETEACFRCAEVGSTKTNRQNTNTYIPSFEIHGVENVNAALQYVAPMYMKSGFLTHPVSGKISRENDDKAILQIYMAVLTEMWEEFQWAADASYMEMKYKNKYDRIKRDVVKALVAQLGEGKTDEDVAAADLEVAMKLALEKYAFTYRGPILKTTTDTLSDKNGQGEVDQRFKKLDAAGNNDGGYYSAKKAWPLQRELFAANAKALKDKTDGPLASKIPASFNVANSITSSVEIGGEQVMVADIPASGGGDTVYWMPPPKADALDTCNFKVIKTGLSETTEEGVDMDGLDYDADCDSDDAIDKANLAHLQDCAAAEKAMPEGEVYTCPPFPEPTCVIPGKAGIQPGQMFTNSDGVQIIISHASSIVPSAIGLLMAIVAALL